MDEDYARLLRDWLLADPGTPRPHPESDDVVIPLPRVSGENRRRNAADDRRGLERPRDPESRNGLEGQPAAEGLGQPGAPEIRRDAEGQPAAEEPEQLRAPESRSAAEERSRWNHPSNWHRRKAARAEIRDRVAEPEEPSWPPRDPDEKPSPLDEQRPWRELDDAIERSRRQALDAATDDENRSR
ncbi:hypothetical protein ACIOD2_17020 [Amycolatopsis sp. NPDC088138]|uniref:hypothetical protein n=1 Tax=Amycolatopsis sp. NPDC088138 TaxID=3363938 RepID=UPI0038066068